MWPILLSISYSLQSGQDSNLYSVSDNIERPTSSTVPIVVPILTVTLNLAFTIPPPDCVEDENLCVVWCTAISQYIKFVF